MFETFSLCLPPLSQVNTPINILWEWAKGIEEKLHFHALYGGQSWAGSLRKDLLPGCQPLQGCLSGREWSLPKGMPFWAVAANHWLRWEYKGGAQICFRAPQGLGQPAEYLNFPSAPKCWSVIDTPRPKLHLRENPTWDSIVFWPPFI